MVDLLSKSTPELMAIVLEYAQLAAMPNLSDVEADRLGEILVMAVHNEILSFWIVEVDHILGHKLSLLDEEDRESYQDQQALLRDYVGVMKNFPVPKAQQISNYKSPIRPKPYQIDGQFGIHT